jgi:hypothetical protein
MIKMSFFFLQPVAASKTGAAAELNSSGGIYPLPEKMLRYEKTRKGLQPQMEPAGINLAVVTFLYF